MAGTPKILTNTPYDRTPPAPNTLSEIGANHWKQVAANLVKDKVLKPIDLPLLEMACKFWEEFQTAETLTDEKKACDAYMKIMLKFGATYEASSKLKIDKQKKAGGDEDSLYDDWG